MNDTENPAIVAGINMAQWYRRPPPSSSNTFQIWNECWLTEFATTYQIFLALDNWMRTNCSITLYDNTYYVEWCSSSGIKIRSTALTFGKWVLCGCIPIEGTPMTMETEPAPPPLEPGNIAPVPETISDLGELLETDEPDEAMYKGSLNDFIALPQSSQPIHSQSLNVEEAKVECSQ